MLRDAFNRHHRVLLIGDAARFGPHFLGRLEDEHLTQFDECGNGAIGVAMALSAPRPFDAVLIAVDLPDADGAVICTQLRERGLHIPVILLAEHGGESEVIRGLNAGANDFMAAPMRHAELRARLRAQIRAYETSEEAVLRIGQFHFRPASRVLLNSATNERVRLTEKEAAVLKFLYRAEAPVSRHTLLHEVWGYNARATTHTVETHIYRLRRKIEPDAGRIAVLINEDGGYRLRAAAPRPAAPRPGPHWAMPTLGLMAAGLS
jgi:DNA-binding response OmpR family regulator